MSGHHHPQARLLAHTENGLKYHRNKPTRRVVVVQQYDFVELGPLQLWFRFRFRGENRIFGHQLDLHVRKASIGHMSYLAPQQEDFKP
ncbi:hypothetical protein D3C73_1028910 [compost metagenome]